MAEQPGNRIPKAPSAPAWESNSAEGAADPDQGNFGTNFSESGGEGGAPEWQSHPNPGDTFSGSGDNTSHDRFEQGELPGTEINYFSFRK